MSARLRLNWDPEQDPAEARRRHLLAVADGLLDEVEELRLCDSTSLTPAIREGLRAFQLQMGRPQPPVLPGTPGAAHDLILGLQSRLLAANPRNTTPRSHPGRAGGQPLMTVVQGGVRWKLLTLPPTTPGQPQQEWLELVAATVERAGDRWEWALHQVQAAARDTRRAGSEWSRCTAAWANYWDLALEQERILARLGAVVRSEAMALSA